MDDKFEEMELNILRNAVDEAGEIAAKKKVNSHTFHGKWSITTPPFERVG